MNVQKLKKVPRVFEIIKQDQDFSSCTTIKKFFRCTSIVLDPDINLKQLDQKFPFGSLIRYGNSSKKIFSKSKFCRLHAILLDCEIYYKKGAGFCYASPCLPSSSFLGHVAGSFFCLYVKIFGSSVYALLDFYSY